jgi:hypothetical protein
MFYGLLPIIHRPPNGGIITNAASAHCQYGVRGVLDFDIFFHFAGCIREKMPVTNHQ